MQIHLIVATDQAHGIGIDNRLPWRLPEDLQYFKRTTSGHTILMGRKTYESIGRPLPQRRNIVISRNPAWQAEGVEVAHSLQQALELAATEEKVFVIGGAQVYQQALPLADFILQTKIAKNFACDAFFPALDPQLWQEVARETHYSKENDCPFEFVTLQRTKPV